jgi:predicted kinase
MSAVQKRFVVVSGLPASGKTTLARALAPALGLRLLDKDDMLERLFAERGTGDRARRQVLSRESDRMLQAEAAASRGAVLVSHWRVPGLPDGSGTPVDWLRELPGRLVHVRCLCPPGIAAARFLERKRHTGHLDADVSYADLVARFQSAAALDLEPAIEVDTTRAPDIEAIVRAVDAAF